MENSASSDDSSSDADTEDGQSRKNKRKRQSKDHSESKKRKKEENKKSADDANSCLSDDEAEEKSSQSGSAAAPPPSSQPPPPPPPPADQVPEDPFSAPAEDMSAEAQILAAARKLVEQATPAKSSIKGSEWRQTNEVRQIREEHAKNPINPDAKNRCTCEDCYCFECRECPRLGIGNTKYKNLDPDWHTMSLSRGVPFASAMYLAAYEDLRKVAIPGGKGKEQLLPNMSTRCVTYHFLMCRSDPTTMTRLLLRDMCRAAHVVVEDSLLAEDPSTGRQTVMEHGAKVLSILIKSMGNLSAIIKTI